MISDKDFEKKTKEIVHKMFVFVEGNIRGDIVQRDAAMTFLTKTMNEECVRIEGISDEQLLVETLSCTLPGILQKVREGNFNDD